MELQINEQLPVFVYGTLLNGFANYDRYLKGLTKAENPTTIKGELFMVTGGGFPALLPGKEDVTGTLMEIKNEMYQEVLSDLDFLEGYDPETDTGMYVRRQISIGPTQAWTYFWNSGSDSLIEKIPGGSFAHHARS